MRTPRRQLRGEVLKQLSERITFDLPSSLMEREIDRRLEEFARQLVQQKSTRGRPASTGAQFREAQREPARGVGGERPRAGRDARREEPDVTERGVDKEIERFASQGRTNAGGVTCTD